MLSLISYKALTNWSVRFLLNADTMKTNYPQCSLGNLLQRNQNTTVVEDNTMYKRVTIKLYGKGVYLRDELRGKDIGTKRQYILSQGQFILSKIDARNGAFGIVPEELDGAITTADFVSFNINTEKVIPDFLRLLVSTEHFAKMCQGQSSGTTGRQRVSLNDLLQIKIPLPVIEKQREIVEKYNSKIMQANEQEKEACNLAKKIEQILFERLDISAVVNRQTSVNNSMLSFVNYSFISRWGVEFLQNDNASKKLLRSNSLPMKKLGDLVEIDPKNNFSALDKDLEMSFIPMEYVSDEYGEVISSKIGCNAYSKGYTRFQEGDLIWAKITPCMQNGKSAILKDLKNGYGYGSTEFYVIRNTNPEVHLDYIYHILRTDVVLKNAMTFFTGSSGQQRVPKSYLENLEIPLPDFATQVQISNDIYEIKSRIKEIKINAGKCRVEAIIDFEKELLG